MSDSPCSRPSPDDRPGNGLCCAVAAGPQFQAAGLPLTHPNVHRLHFWPAGCHWCPHATHLGPFCFLATRRFSGLGILACATGGTAAGSFGHGHSPRYAAMPARVPVLSQVIEDVVPAFEAVWEQLAMGGHFGPERRRSALRSG